MQLFSVSVQNTLKTYPIPVTSLVCCVSAVSCWCLKTKYDRKPCSSLQVTINFCTWNKSGMPFFLPKEPNCQNHGSDPWPLDWRSDILQTAQWRWSEFVWEAECLHGILSLKIIMSFLNGSYKNNESNWKYQSLEPQIIWK